MMAIDQICEQAAGLSAADRGELIRRLIVSLDEGESIPEEEADRAWTEVAKRRLAEVESGEVQPIPWDEAKQSILRRLEQKS